ncbi:MAG: T9SS type A sorting domain-containing protein [Crocinitomicaceae bacterium]
MKKLLLLLVLTLSVVNPNDLFSQLDNTHYIPPMFGREDYGTHYIVLSTPSTTPFDVTITDGAGNLITTQTISNALSSSYMLGSGNGTELLVQSTELNTVMNNKGLILTGSEPFFVNIRVYADPQAGSLTSKGSKAAFGTDFRTGHLYNNTGYSNGKSNMFSFMATEDNTTVTVTDIRPGVIFHGTTPTGAPLTSPDVTVTLDAGESYVMAAYIDESGATENLNGVNGTHITSDKAIVVNSGSWLGGNALIGGAPQQGRDLGIDQIVPLETIGDEYVLIKGEGIDNEKTIVIASQDNTDIYLDGNAVAVATINAGDYYVIDGTAFSTNDNIYLESSAPVYVYQTSNGGNGATDDNERQCGLNFIPPIGCSGSKSVVLPDVDFIGTAFINIIANAGSNVYVNGALLPAGDAVTGTANYVTHKLTSGYTGDVTVTSDDLIRVALINVSGNIGASGYFSGFTKDVVVQTQTVNGDNIALEGCIQASFTFNLDSPSNEDTEISYTVAGTANNGVDYAWIDSVLTIPAGQTSATIFVDAISDGVPEGQESIYIIYQPDLCSPVDTAYLFIDDAQPIDFTLAGIDLNCNGSNTGAIDVNTTGGFPPYNYDVKDDQGNITNYTSSPITGLAAGLYTVYVYDSYGCQADALVVGGLFDADTTFLPDGNGVTYTTQINIQGFDAGETLDDMSQLQQICATMEHSYLGDLNLKIISPSGQSCVLKSYPGGGSCDLGIPFAAGPVDGQNSNLTDPGQGYEYCFNDSPIYGTMVAESNNYQHTYPSSLGGGQTVTDNYLPQGSYTSEQPLSNLLGSTMNGNWTLEITDNLSLDNGYVFTWNISLLSDAPDSTVTIEEPNPIDIAGFISQANCGGNDGAINISVTGDFPPYTYAWSNGATTEDISNIPAGTYKVVVTDATGCSDSMTFNLNNISSMNLSTSITPVTCTGGNDGAIDITVSGGTSPYTFAWSNGPTTEDVSTLTAGTYTVSVTDNNGCIYSEDITVNSLPGINVSLVSKSNENCGTGNGAIDINVSGGSGSYGYSWSNGGNTQDISNLTAGTYTVNVTDGNGCTASGNWSIVNDVTGCSQFCYLAVSANSITDETCGNGTGAIDVNIINATFPYTISWSTGATVEDISSLDAGTYTITVLDANQCEVTEDFTVGNNTGNLSVSNYSITDENCGNGTGAIDITVAGGSLPYSYSWTNGATTQDLSNLYSGDYTVSITDGAGCTFDQMFQVSNNTGNLSASETVVNEVCGLGNGAVYLSVSGAVGTPTFIWSNGATTEDITGLTAGTYSCIISDGTGCTFQTADFNVINGANDLQITFTNIDNENCLDGQGAIDITVIGGTPNYAYNWSNGGTTQDLSGLSAGIYNCTITDQLGCSISTGDMTVFNSSSNLNIDLDNVVDEICGNHQGSIFVTVTGGTAPLTYAWSDGASTEDNLNVAAGSYTLTVTDVNGCTTQDGFTVSNDAGTLGITNMLVTNEICGNGAGAIDVIPTGGTMPYTYSWDSGQSTEDITGLVAGSYAITITDVNGCETSSSATVVNNASGMSYSEVITVENCSDGSGAIDLTVTGGAAPYTFLWSNAAVTEDLTGLSAGTFTCEITDNNGCILNTNDIVVSNNPGTLFAQSSVSDEECGQMNGSIFVNAAGGDGNYTYSWSIAGTGATQPNLSAGTYDWTVTDGNGCTVSGSETVNNIAGTLSLDNVTYADEVCNDDMGSIDITVSGGTGALTYAWSNAAITEDISGLNEGTYSCTITDAIGCSISTGNIVISNNANTISIDNISVTDESCGNGTGAVDITISGGTGPYTYSWSNLATSQDIANLNAGVYTCTIVDAGGCIANLQATVNNNAGNLQVFSAIVTNESCGATNGAINITVAGGTPSYTFAWSNSATTEDISGLDGGNYSVTITDAGGCTVTDQFTVQDLGANLAVSNYTIQDEICGNGAGAINITVAGGATPYAYNWSNGSTFEDVSGLSAGAYSVSITDANGCTTSANYNVNLNTGTLNVSAVSVTDENCGDGQGAIDMTIAGGIAPLSISWSNGATWEDLSGLSAGTYNLTVTDVNGCQASSSQTVANNSAGFAATINTVTDENCGQADGAINIDVTGGATPYTFLWSNAATTEDISNLSAGNYSVTVTDGNGCATNVNATVTNITGTLAISSSFVQNETCGNGAGFIDISVTGGTTPYTFLWSNSATTEDILSLSAGTYDVTITDNLGCILTDSWTVGDNGAGSISVTATTTDEICGNGQGAIDATVSGGVPPLSIVWSNTATMEDISGLTAGSYTINISDDVGCSTSASFDVNASTNTNLAFTNVGVQDEFCGGNDGQIQVQVSGGAVFTYYLNGLSYSIGGTFEIFNNLNVGNYLVTVEDENGCQIDSTIFVDTGVPFNAFIASVTDENCGQMDGAIDLQIGGGPNPTIEWSTGETTEDISGLAAGNYYVILTLTFNPNCVDTLWADVMATGDFTASGVTSDENCGDAAGAIDVTVTGTDTYSYSWSNGETTEDLSDLSAGNYSVVITNDNSGCTQNLDFIVINNTGGINASGVVTANDLCNQGLGAIDVSVTGGSGNYVYAWSNGANTQDISGLNEGLYSCEIRDVSNGCEFSLDFQIDNQSNFTINGTTTDATCPTCPDGAVDVTVNPNGTYTYSWSNGEITEDLTGVLPGAYTITVTDQTNCWDTITFVVSGTVSIQENSEEVAIEVYPNPAQEEFNISYNFLNTSKIQMEIKNPLGQIIDQKSFDGAEGIINVNSSKWENGIYFIKISTEEHEIVKRVVITQN